MGQWYLVLNTNDPTVGKLKVGLDAEDKDKAEIEARNILEAYKTRFTVFQVFDPFLVYEQSLVEE